MTYHLYQAEASRAYWNDKNELCAGVLALPYQVLRTPSTVRPTFLQLRGGSASTEVKYPSTSRRIVQ